MNPKLAKNCPYLLDLGKKLPTLTTPSLPPWLDAEFQTHFNNPEKKFLDRQRALHTTHVNSTPATSKGKTIRLGSEARKLRNPNDLFDNVDYSELGGVITTTRMRSEPDDMCRGIFGSPIYDDSDNNKSGIECHEIGQEISGKAP